ncbi:hypothetical protein ACQP1P_17560 [Dactylosporangium sp. CA-052675]|uniref:hypothetical protein n=1 Tax=Dactylosporangium sp. CA-052675 TaxID=3239927 RepID=UPI003D8BF792
MQLIKAFPPERFAGALDSWRWAGVEGKTPAFASLFGDVFLRGADGIWRLDTIGGTIEQRWPSMEALSAELNTAEGQERYLLAGLAAEMARRGLTPQDDQVYDFTHPPALGGAIEPDNVDVIDFVVGVNLAGQLHDQLRALPPGTTIRAVSVDDGRLTIDS